MIDLVLDLGRILCCFGLEVADQTGPAQRDVGVFASLTYSSRRTTVYAKDLANL